MTTDPGDLVLDPTCGSPVPPVLHRQLVEHAEQMIGIRATYVQMTPDVMMGDLLKNMRSSQIFSVCGLPEIELRKRTDGKYELELLGLDVFDPVTAEAVHSKGDAQEQKAQQQKK